MNAKEQVKREYIKAQIRKMLSDDLDEKFEALDDEQDLKRSLEFLEWLEDRNGKRVKEKGMETAFANEENMCMRCMR